MMKIERTITVNNKLGVHARAAAQLAKLSSSFNSDIKLQKQAQQADAKSIMGVMMLAATQGTILDLSVEGEDAKLATNAIVNLFANYFGEDE